MIVKKKTPGGLAQLVERVLSMHKVVDSISTFSTFFFPFEAVCTGIPFLSDSPFLSVFFIHMKRWSAKQQKNIVQSGKVE